MNQEEQIITPQNFEDNKIQIPTKSKGKSKKVPHILLVIILLAGACAGGYFYGKGQQKAPVAEQPSSSSKVKVENNTADGVHFVKSKGSPTYATPKGYFITELGLPANIQAVATSSTTHNEGAEQYFTKDGNAADELARWYVADYRSGGYMGQSEISILAITQPWLDSTMQEGVAQNAQMLYGKLTTPADKKQYIAKVKADSAECVKDSKKGFSAGGGVFNICYTFDAGTGQGYHPRLTLLGYGEKNSVNMIFTGSIDIYDPQKTPTQEEVIKLVDDAKKGKLTTAANEQLTSLINALKQTKLTVEKLTVEAQ